MTLEKLKKYLTKQLKDNIFDIVLYGSSVKGKRKPNDIDILVIFLEGSLKERLVHLQNIKQKTNLKLNIDFKQILLEELFFPSFLARTGVLIEGFSIKKKKFFAETLGFKSYSLFTYNLSKLTHAQKVKFNYILAGRNKKGMLEELEGFRLVSGAVKIPIKNSLTFEEILNNNEIQYIKKNILEQI